TRFSRDWSSDVCSSDLEQVLATASEAGEVKLWEMVDPAGLRRRTPNGVDAKAERGLVPASSPAPTPAPLALRVVRELKCGTQREIGRASCRERGEVEVG